MVTELELLCAATQCHALIHPQDVEGEGRLRPELRAGWTCWTCSLSSNCYWEEKGVKKERKKPSLIISSRLLPFLRCTQEEARGLPCPPLPQGNCSWREDLVKICKVLWPCSSPGEMIDQILKKGQAREKPASLRTSLIRSSTNSFHGFGTAPYVQGGRGSYWVLNYRGEKHLKFLSIYTHNFSKSLCTNPLASAELLTGYRAKKEVELAISLSETWRKFPKKWKQWKLPCQAEKI